MFIQKPIKNLFFFGFLWNIKENNQNLNKQYGIELVESIYKI